MIYSKIIRIYKTVKEKGLVFIVLRKFSGKYKNPNFFLRLLIKSENEKHFRHNSLSKERFLEIGPGVTRLPGFETLNIKWDVNVDYVYDAEDKLPFNNNTFDLVYTSHILEHLPWYKTEGVLKEWHRILKTNGKLIVFVPDGLKIMNTIIGAEENRINDLPDNWQMLNPKRNIYLWANGHLFYGANPNYPSWHKSFFTYNYLEFLFENSGFINIQKTDPTDILGVDHGWINLGIKGIKKI